MSLDVSALSPGDDADRRFLQRALKVADAAPRRNSPNPTVGAVVVAADGTIVAEAATDGRHAEDLALEAAGSAAHGATLYVTLEPCKHWGRHPPCTDAVVAAGIVRVVSAQADPDPAGGGGTAVLLAAGIDAVFGPPEVTAQAQRQLAAFRHHRRTGLPFVTLKVAATVDGATAAPDGTSQWITGAASRADVHALRRASDAIIVGAGTVLADDCRLTVRTGPPADPPPLRVVLDARGRVPATAAIMRTEDAPTLICTVHAPPAVRSGWEAAGAEVVDVAASHDGVGCDPAAVRELLAARPDILAVMVEGGAAVAGAFLRAGVWDRLRVYTGAALAGGDEARRVFAGPGAASIDAFVRLRLDSVVRLGEDVRCDWLPAAAPGPDAEGGSGAAASASGPDVATG